jgi:hypothetical protein
MENKNIKNDHFKFRKMYKFIKDNIIIKSDATSLINPTFSIQLFYQILFTFSIIKTLLTLFYFVVLNGIYNNSNILLLYTQFFAAFLLTQQQNIIKIKNKSFKKIKINESILEKVLKWTFVLSFQVEENMTMFYFPDFIFGMSPSFIFCAILLLIYFSPSQNQKKISETLFYLYVFNMVLLIYYPSVRTLMRFFFPVTLVLAMFILLNIISLNFNKKMAKYKLYQSYFEQLMQLIFKIQEIYVIYDGKKIIYKDEEKDEKVLETRENNNEDDLLLNPPESVTERSEMISECSMLETKPNQDFKTLQIPYFKGFEIFFKQQNECQEFLYFSKNHIVSFINLLFFLTSTKGANDKTDSQYLSELSKIYTNSKTIIRNYKLKNLIDISIENAKLPIKEKIICVIVCFIFEASSDNYSLSLDDLISTTKATFHKVEFILNKNHIQRKEVKSLISNIEELSMSLNFEFVNNTQESEHSLIIKFSKRRDSLMFNTMGEEEISFDDFKIPTPKSPFKKSFNFNI